MHVVELIQSLFRADIENDKREPIISLPLLDFGTVGLMAPNSTFWLQLAMVREYCYNWTSSRTVKVL